MKTFFIILFFIFIAVILIVYFVKRYQIKIAEKNVKKLLEEHEEKVFIEEIKQIKSRNFLEKATNGKDERVW